MRAMCPSGAASCRNPDAFFLACTQRVRGEFNCHFGVGMKYLLDFSIKFHLDCQSFYLKSAEIDVFYISLSLCPLLYK